MLLITRQMEDKLRNNINTIYIVGSIILIVGGWFSNYIVLREKINYIQAEKNELKAQVLNIEVQIKDYNVLTYKVDKIDRKLDILINRGL